MARHVLASFALLTALALAVPGVTAATTDLSTPQPAPSGDSRSIIGIGGECDQTIHLDCGHITGNGPCVLYVGGPNGACVIWTQDHVVGYGGECDAVVHTMCSHWSAQGVCLLYLGGPNGACIIWMDQ